MAAKDMEKQIVDDWNNNAGTPVTDYLKQMGCRGNAEHLGNRQFSPSAEWASYNRQKSYSKTDIKIGSHKISLKSMNDHIMMSAKKNEALATFMCVSNELYENRIPSLIMNITKEMEGLITKAVSPITIVRAKKAGVPEIINAEKKHAKILDSMERIFDDPVFITAFIKEVLSGRLKFGENSDGSATHILYLRDTPTLNSLDDMSFISNVAGHVDIRIDFKSVKKTQGSEYGMYRYWSVLQMISKELIKDSVIYEESFFKKSLSFVISVLSNIRKSITSWNDLFEFLDVEPEITITLK